MGIVAEIVMLVVRAGVQLLGAWLVQRGCSDAVAKGLTDAVPTIAAGLVFVLVTLGASTWQKVRAYAFARLSQLYPAGTPGRVVLDELAERGKRELWRLAREAVSASTSKADAKDALTIARGMVAAHSALPDRLLSDVVAEAGEVGGNLYALEGHASADAAKREARAILNGTGAHEGKLAEAFGKAHPDGIPIMPWPPRQEEEACSGVVDGSAGDNGQRSGDNGRTYGCKCGRDYTHPVTLLCDPPAVKP